MRNFRRPFNDALAKLARALDKQFLLESRCFHSGGSQLALTLGEFRLSSDLDFLCSHRDGYRRIRETVTETSLGRLLRRPVKLVRNVNTANDGIRTVVAVDGQLVKLAILIEARLTLSGAIAKPLGLPTLDFDLVVAEKFLANADRGIAESTRHRDLIDLAALAAEHGVAALQPGLALARSTYGAAIDRCFHLVLERLQRPRVLGEAATALSIEDPAPIRKGLRLLATSLDRDRER